jgi:hypothetical protein
MVGETTNINVGSKQSNKRSNEMTKHRLYLLARAELLRLWSREYELSKQGNNIAMRKATLLKIELEKLEELIRKEDFTPPEFLLNVEE